MRAITLARNKIPPLIATNSLFDDANLDFPLPSGPDNNVTSKEPAHDFSRADDKIEYSISLPYS